MQERGSKAQLRAYYEVTPGENPSTRNGVRLPAIDIAIGKTQGLVQSRVLQGNRSETRPSRDEITVGGGTTLQPDVRSIGWILRGLLGSYSVTGPVGGLYTHLFKVDALNTYYALEKFFASLNKALMYVGCKPNGLTWDIGTGGLQECGVDWVGMDEVLEEGGPEDATPLLHPVVGFKVPSVTLAQAGVTLTKATRFGINLANNIEGTRTIGNGGRVSDLPEGTIGVSGPFEVTFESFTQYQKALNDTEESLVVTYPAAGGMSLQWLMDEVLYEAASPAVPGPGGLTQAINYRAFWDDAAAASAIRALLVNDVPTYAAIP